MKRLPLALALLALAGCGGGDRSQGTSDEPPRGKAVRETKDRARERVRDSDLSPKLKRELEEAQRLLDEASE